MKNCNNCNVELSPKTRGNTCSRTCAAILRNKHRVRTSRKKIRLLNCQNCKLEYSVVCTDYKYINGLFTKFCSINCANVRIFSDEYRLKIKERFKNGELIPYWTNKKMPIKMREKISQKMTDLHIKNGNLGHFINVKWYDVNNCLGESFKVRGSYELKIHEYLNNENIVWVNNKKITYVDLEGIKRNYIPDFYLPKYDTYIEAKGYYPEKDILKMRLVFEQHNIKLLMIFKEDLINLDNKLLNIIK